MQILSKFFIINT